MPLAAPVIADELCEQEQTTADSNAHKGECLACSTCDALNAEPLSTSHLREQDNVTRLVP
jgi:hypothetical protein